MSEPNDLDLGVSQVYGKIDLANLSHLKNLARDSN